MSQGQACAQRGLRGWARLTAWVAAGLLLALGTVLLPAAQASGSDVWLGQPTVVSGTPTDPDRRPLAAPVATIGAAPVAAPANSAPLDRTGSNLLGLQVAGVGLLAAAMVFLAGRWQAAKGEQD